MSRRTVSWLGYSIVALALLLGVLGCLLLLNDHFPPPSGGYILAFLSFLVVGVLITSRRPENPIGWMFCIIGLASVWEFFATEYAIYALNTRPGTDVLCASAILQRTAPLAPLASVRLGRRCGVYPAWRAYGLRARQVARRARILTMGTVKRLFAG